MPEVEPEVPDLRSLLAEASRPSASCVVPLKQGLRERIADAEAELAQIAEDAPSRRMGAASPLKEKAREIEAMRAEMAASALTFHFEALTVEQREQIRKDMQSRDEPDETNLRAIAAMCSRVTSAGGVDFSERMAWTDFRDLRDKIGAQTFDLTIDAAASRAGGGEWSVPFSFAASHILGTEK